MYFFKRLHSKVHSSFFFYILHKKFRQIKVRHPISKRFSLEKHISYIIARIRAYLYMNCLEINGYFYIESVLLWENALMKICHYPPPPTITPSDGIVYILRIILFYLHVYKFELWKYPNGRVAPEQHANLRHFRSNALQMNGAARAV